MYVPHSVPIIQMFQAPALIVMSIAATRMHRSLTDFANSEYNASCLLRSFLMLIPPVKSTFSKSYLRRCTSRHIQGRVYHVLLSRPTSQFPVDKLGRML
jgi:hypothetical protein